MKKLLIFTSVIAMLALIACTPTTVPPTTVPPTTAPTTAPTNKPTQGKDSYAPLLELKKEAVEVFKGTDAFDPIANIKTAIDDVDGDIKSAVVIDNGGYTGIDTVAGVYTIKYSLSDAAGNKSSAQCVVTVIEVEPSLIFGERRIAIAYNPLVNSYWSTPKGVGDNWAYDLTKVSVLTKAYFEHVANTSPERISIRWSTAMITDKDLKVTYVRHHGSFGYYMKDDQVVTETSDNWCTGTSTGTNAAFCDVDKQAGLANLVGSNVKEYAKIPEGGYVFIFINDGANTAVNCPRNFGDAIHTNTPNKFGVGEQLKIVGVKGDITNDNAPAYLKTADNKVMSQVKYGEVQPNLMDGITYVSKKGSTDLQVTKTIYQKAVDGKTYDLEAPVTEFNMTAPAEVDGKIPARWYAVKYNVTENGITDTLYREYEVVDNAALIVSTKDTAKIGDFEAPFLFNEIRAFDKNSGGILAHQTYKDTVLLYDAKTLINALKERQALFATEAYTDPLCNINYSSIYILNSDFKVTQLRFFVAKDEMYTLNAEGVWIKQVFRTIDPNDKDSQNNISKHDLFTDFLGDSPIMTLPSDGYVLISQNGNTDIRKFGINMYNTAGLFRDDVLTPEITEGWFDQGEFLKENALKLYQNGYNAQNEVISQKPYSIQTKVKLSTSAEIYEMDYDHNWMWIGGEASNVGNTNLRFHAGVIHLVSKEFSKTFDEKFVYLPNSSMVILDKNFKVVGVRVDIEYGTPKVHLQAYVSFDEAGATKIINIADVPEWKLATDVSQGIDAIIPEGGYAFTIMVNSAFKTTMLTEILTDLANIQLGNVTFGYVYSLKLA